MTHAECGLSENRPVRGSARTAEPCILAINRSAVLPSANRPEAHEQATSAQLKFAIHLRRNSPLLRCFRPRALCGTSRRSLLSSRIHLSALTGVTLAAACYLISPPLISAALALGLRASQVAISCLTTLLSPRAQGVTGRHQLLGACVELLTILESHSPPPAASAHRRCSRPRAWAVQAAERCSARAYKTFFIDLHVQF